MNTLVTGGAGYLGSVLVPKLVARGHSVRVLDVGYFGTESIRGVRPAIDLVRDDIRRVISDSSFADDLLSGCDCVIHLSAISNDPSAELNPRLTHEVNFEATVAMAEAARRQGARFLFSSSCSVYGEADYLLDEEGPVQPQTVYAESKVEAERALLEMADETWKPLILRNGTLFGFSPRMRFDLVVNIFSLYSALYGEIKVFGSGMQWRPYLHVRDCARAFTYLAELEQPRHPCYNVAHENLRVTQVANIFSLVRPGLQVTHHDLADIDNRDYRVRTDRLRDEGFSPRVTVEAGAEEMIEAVVSGAIPDPESVFYRNAKWLRELTEVGSKGHRDLVGLMETMSNHRPLWR